MAVPVFAVSPAQGAGESPSLAEVPAPSASELAEAEREEREQAEWLLSPKAEEQREASSNAYTNLTAGEARNLLVEAFPLQLKALNADPARVLSTLEVEKPLGTYGALVSDEEGESAILDSSVPVQSDLGGEGKEPVDLALEQVGNSFLPQNPLTEVELPGSAEEPIQLQSGVEVELPASDDHGAVPLGAMNLFYPETETATDTLVSPKAGGVEVFEQLRSPESPERFNFALQLPNEATVRPSEAGGAEIVSSSGETIGEVPPPSATDAQGAAVPVTTSIEGDSLVLEVSHRSREVAYPVLLDPEYVNDTTSFGEWSPSLSSGYEYYLNNNWSSLDAISRGHYYYPAYTHGQWAYGAYGQTAYIAAATFSPVDYIVHSCQTYEPHGYIGLYNPGSGQYDALGIWATWSSEGPYETGWRGNTGTRDAIIGIGTSGAGVEIGCAHELYVGGYSIQEKDPEAPTVNWVGGTSASWVKDITVTPHVSDPGLGVKAITLSPEGSDPHTNSQGCSGANGSRCPGSWETSFGGSYFAEGERSASISAYDPLGSSPNSDPNHVSSSYQFTTRLDRQDPEVEVEGEFTEALEEAEEEGEGQEAPALHLPVYNLKIVATDKANEGNPKTEPKARRSGVKNIAVFLDGKEMKVPWGAQGCSGPEYSCPMEKTYPVPMDEVEGGGVHELEVIAEDQVGNKPKLIKEFEYFPATGMKDEYVMQHFPLPDGEGEESEEEHPNRPELAVNVTNGNLVFRQKDVEVAGPDVNLEVERFYNSQLPEEDNTEWGDGWTLAQTPKLEPEETKEEAPPAKASMVRTSGALESAVGLPAESGGTQFDKKLQAVVSKEPGGGYEVEDQSGETDTSLAFDKAGKVKELRTPGYAKVNYEYEEGDLAEIAVHDAASFGGGEPNEAEEAGSAPTATTGAATDVQMPQVTLHGIINPGGEDTSYSFQYVDGAGFEEDGFAEAAEAPATPRPIGSSSSDQVVAEAVGGLEPGTTYHFRVVAENSQGAANGAEKTFTTPEWALAGVQEPEGAAASNLLGTSCTSATECTAVGYYTHQGTRVTLAMHRAGGEWSSEPTPNPAGAGESRLVSVSCATAEDCTAVGYYVASGQHLPLAEHFDGEGWTLKSAPNPSGATQAYLESVSCPSSGFCLATGHYTASAVEHPLAETWNGSAFSVASGAKSGKFGAATLPGASCASATDCWAVGRSHPTPAEEQAATGTYEEEAWEAYVAEEYERAEELWQKAEEAAAELVPQALAEHFDGSTWSTAALPSYPRSLIAVSCPSSSFCAALGAEGMRVERFDGSAWSAETAPQPPAGYSAYLKAISCTSSTACTAVGHYTPKSESEWWWWNSAPLAEHFDGSAWAAEQTTDPAEVFEHDEWHEGYLHSVSCSTASACAATGYFVGEDEESSVEALVVEAYGQDKRPLASTEAAGELGTSEATLKATVDPKGLDTVYHFEYGPTAAYGVKAPVTSEDIGSENGGIQVSQPIEGLGEGTTYHFRVVAENDGGIRYGEDRTFTTLKLPTATTQAATGVAGGEATLHATVNPKGSDTKYRFEYGTTGSYGSEAPASAKDIGSEEGAIAVAQTINALKESTTYHFRVIAESAAGVVVGEDETFTTPHLPTITPNAASNVRNTGATLSAAIDPNGLQTTYQIEYGPSKAYGLEAPAAPKDIGSGTNDVEVNQDIEGLKPSTLYHFRIAATTEAGTVRSPDLTFTTPPPVFTLALGEASTGNGQLGATIGGIAVDPEGDVYVADSANHRIEKFSPSGTYLDQFGEEGAGTGQLGATIGGIAVDPEGDVYVADSANHRIEKFSPSGTYLDQFGEAGPGNGQLGATIGGIAVDYTGDVWAVDSDHSRVEEFGTEGQYLSQFGEAGTGDGQFSQPTGLAMDSRESLLVGDQGNSRVQKWFVSRYEVSEEPEPMPVDKDPKVEVETSAGLVESVEGEQAGQTTYGHEGELLTAVDGPKGETEYQYDSEERLTKVTLPNGTWGEVKYDEFGRVKSVTVSVEGGKAKATYFTYKEEPRRTTVSPEGAPITVYDIAPDGSVLKWWNKQEPPEIENLSGSLYANKETPEPVEPGDYELLVQAHSVEGIASIDIVANGNQVVDEKTCEQDYENEVTECQTVEDPWVTETASWPPGIIYLEVIVTDSVEGTETVPNTESAKFWVNIPYTPPPDPEAEEAPKFNEVLRFREEFGLDLDLKGNELAIDERIFDLIGDWTNPHTPAGEVARATYERWGVPLRAVDVAELEYREWFYNLDAERIDQWVEETKPSSFAGYYIDQAAGGIMHVGFTSSQTEQLDGLKASLSLVAGDRLQVYPVAPTVSYLSVQAASESVSNAIESNSTLGELVVGVKFDESGRAVYVGTPNVAQVESILDEMLGPSVAIVVEYGTDEGSLLSGRFRNEGRMRAGDAIFTEHYTASYPSVHDGNGMCTAGFGAKDKAGDAHGQPLWRLFVLTAGHCNLVAHPGVYRSTDSDFSLGNEGNWKEIGEVRRRAYRVLGESPTTDAEAIRVEAAGIVPQGIFGTGGNLRPTQPAATVKKGEVVCFSGARAQGVSCGPIIGRTSFWAGAGDGAAHAGYWVRFRHPAGHGDSGAPVYSAAGQSIGLVEAGRNGLTETLVQPLLTPPGMNSAKVPGILNNPNLRPLSLKLGG
jgi:YD repeat-containing protein